MEYPKTLSRSGYERIGRPARETMVPPVMPEKCPDNTCGKLSGCSLAMVYSPYQPFQNLYEVTDGFCRGTIFRELDKPFFGGRMSQ